MISKRFILIYSVILLVIALALHVIRGDYVVESYEKKDIFNEYQQVKKKSSLNFDTVKNEETERFLIIYDSTENDSLKLYKNAEQVLNNMKKKFISVDIKSFKGNLANYTNVILCFEEIDSFDYFETLFRYIENGGNVIFAEKPKEGSRHFESIYRKLGIYEKGSIKSTTGIKLNSNILIKGKELGMNWSFRTDAVTVHLQNDCKRLAVSGDNMTLIWQKSYGIGTVTFVNGKFLLDKNNRGLFVGLLSNTSNSFIYPIINAKVMFIDEFPSPSMSGYNEIIKEHYRRTQKQFYRDIWWKEMLKISNKYNIKYSGYLIKSYDASASGNSETRYSDETTENIKFFGRELFKNKGELGIQGYSDVDIYNIGLEEQELSNKLKELENAIKNTYKKYYLESYVPPLNKFNSNGRKLVKDAMPDLKVISSIYSAYGMYQDGYEQEFDMGKDGVLNFPRTSYGYSADYMTMWNMYNSITTHGVFSHFITPEQVGNSIIYEGKKVEDIFDEFSELMKDNYNNFNWLISYTAAEGALQLNRYLECDTAFKYEKDNIRGYLKNFTGNMFFILKSDKNPGNVVGCKIMSKIDDDKYLVKAEDAEFYIELGEEK